MKITKVIFSILLAFSVLTFPFWVKAEECTDIGNLNDKIKCLSDQVGRLSEQSKTLSNQIAQFNAQIYLTTLKIAQTEEKIALLGGRIDQLEISLSSLSNAFSSRAVETYKMSRVGDSFFLLISSPNLTQAVTRFRYLQKIQEADRDLLQRLQSAQTNYKGQKVEQETLQKQLDQQKADLNNQKLAKANLLAVTKNDENRYLQLLAQAQAELQALANSQFTGKREVRRGDVIGLMGSTGFSTGPHLHFGYYNIREEEVDSLFVNAEWYFSRYDSPLDALQSKTLHFEYLSCDDVQQRSGIDRAIGNGSLPWPMSNPEITQCFGHTPYSSVYRGNFHQGLDMADTNDILVRTVDDGVAYFYRGSSSFGNNVRIFHPNGKMSLYMHLQ